MGPSVYRGERGGEREWGRERERAFGCIRDTLFTTNFTIPLQRTIVVLHNEEVNGSGCEGRQGLVDRGVPARGAGPVSFASDGAEVWGLRGHGQQEGDDVAPN